MSSNDANLVLFQYRRGFIPAEQFIKEMRDMNYSTQQIVNLMNVVNNPRAPINVQIPEPDGNVLPPEAYANPAQQPMTDEQRLNGMGITLPGAAPQASPQPAPQQNPAVDQARELIESRLDRARPQDAPNDTGSPAGNMGFPQSLPSAPPSQRVVSAAKQAIAQRAAPQPAPQPQAQGEGPGFLTSLVRGDFREGADQRIMDAMRRQKEESGVDGGMARGGAAEKPKKSSRDDVLHKALEIIHQLMMRR